MRAILIATGDGPGIGPLNEWYPTPLLPLVDRPFIQHVVEFLITQGITRFDLVLSHLPEKIESFLGDGKRWGRPFTFHLARDPSRPYRLLQTLDFSSEAGPFLLGHADRLPHFQLDEARLAAARSAPVLFCRRNDSVSRPEDPWHWTGWALVSAEHLAGLPADADENGLKTHLTGISGVEPHYLEVPPLLNVQTFGDLLTSHRVVLAKEFPGLLLGGRETDPGVWLSRNVVLHPTARIVPPTYIGENCQIGAGAQLGPDAVIGSDCVLDGHCTVTNSVTFPGSYVGEGLELTDVIVDKNCLINARLGGTVTIADDFILGNLSSNELFLGGRHLLARVAALLLLAFAGPILLGMVLYRKIARRGQTLHQKEVVCLPASSEERQWRTFALWSFLPEVNPPEQASFLDFCMRFLPALVNIIKGELSFVGVPPRTREEVKALPHDWQCLYLRVKPGLVTEALIRYGAHPTADELYAAEAFYAVTAGWVHDLKLLSRYLVRVFFGFLRHNGGPAGSSA